MNGFDQSLVNVVSSTSLISCSISLLFLKINNNKRLTRCLKCAKDHKAGVFHLKDKLDNPIYINCGVKGHVASLSRVAGFSNKKIFTRAIHPKSTIKK
ncbi:hypothetical protein CEXT_144941 [Caerostris extrusa]|uniref:Uncharacterized protein n=1 Tax=Caerostris extrusa TaxID=172846 RepID=A0AAV4RFJ7_CAEEX|nr:hypothetical protein CEXT_144941 [Caerostris extrusa]